METNTSKRILKIYWPVFYNENVNIKKVYRKFYSKKAKNRQKEKSFTKVLFVLNNLSNERKTIER